MLGIVLIYFLTLGMRYIKRNIWLTFQILGFSGLIDRIGDVGYRVVPCTDKIIIVVETKRIPKDIVGISSNPD